jgi:hypothetical protein
MKVEAELDTGKDKVNIKIKWEMFEELDEFPIESISINGTKYAPISEIEHVRGSIHTRLNRMDERIMEMEKQLNNKKAKESELSFAY